MTDEGEPLDYGPRSNESSFGAFDTSPAEWRDTPLWANPDSAPARPAAEFLPFHIGLVDNEADLLRVQALRQAAYGHHLPHLAASFGQPDVIDRLPDVTIFYARDKTTGLFVGSARIQANRSSPLQIERSLVLPAHRRGTLLSEISRLTVLPGYTEPVRLALVKACHLYCIAMQIGGVVVGSRRALLRQYLNLGFSDLYGDDRLVPLAHGGGLEHRILFRDTVTSEADSRARQHPDYHFVFRTYHPDIAIFDPVRQRGLSGSAASPGGSGYASRVA